MTEAQAKIAKAIEICRNEIGKKQEELAGVLILRSNQNGNMYADSFINQVNVLTKHIDTYMLNSLLEMSEELKEKPKRGRPPKSGKEEAGE